MVTTIRLHVVSGSRGCSRRPVLGPGSPAAVADQGAACAILGLDMWDSSEMLTICASGCDSSRRRSGRTGESVRFMRQASPVRPASMRSRCARVR
jgi:hypothetical protein